MTLSDYSKPSKDIKLESDTWQTLNNENLSKQRITSKHLAKSPKRSSCLLCGSSISSVVPYKHRSVDYFFCKRILRRNAPISGPISL